MSQPASVGDRRPAVCKRLVGITETEKNDAQQPLRVYVRVVPGLVDERAVGGTIRKREHLFEMRSG